MLPEALARELISSHQQRPRHVGAQLHAHRAERYNTACGDQLSVWVSLQGEQLNVTFEGKGCAISQASASMMSEKLSGLTKAQAQQVAGEFREMVLGALPSETLGELMALAGVSKLLARRRCALLAWEALDQALALLP